MISELVKKAARFAANAHVDQLRKYTYEPYIIHPTAVAELVKTTKNCTDNMICAAYLHDVVEDCNVSFEKIETEFNKEVKNLVFWLTDYTTPEFGNRATRKAHYLKFISSGPAEAHTLKIADLIDNTKTIVKHDLNFAAIYLQEKKELLNVLIKGDDILLEWAFGQLNHEMNKLPNCRDHLT